MKNVNLKKFSLTTNESRKTLARFVFVTNLMLISVTKLLNKELELAKRFNYTESNKQTNSNEMWILAFIHTYSGYLKQS